MHKWTIFVVTFQWPFGHALSRTVFLEENFPIFRNFRKWDFFFGIFLGYPKNPENFLIFFFSKNLFFFFFVLIKLSKFFEFFRDYINPHFIDFIKSVVVLFCVLVFVLFTCFYRLLRYLIFKKLTLKPLF